MKKTDRRQRWFNKMIRGLAAQNWGRSSKRNGTCMYRGPGDKKCPVGFIVNDKCASELDNETLSVQDLVYRKDLAMLGLGALSTTEIQFLIDVQFHHDNVNRGRDMKRELKLLGSHRNLSWPKDMPA